MDAKSHSYTGCLLGATAVVASSGISKESIMLIPLGALLGTLGGLTPDIDKRGSRISHKFPILSFISEKAFGHRGILHTPFFVLLLEILCVALCKVFNLSNEFVYLYQIFIIGYLSHLVLDFITPRGIMLAYPVSRSYVLIIGLNSRFRNEIVNIIITLIVGLTIYFKFIV